MPEQDTMQGYQTDTFCETSWCEDDLRKALEDCEVPVTEKNVEKLRQFCEEGGLIEAMIQAGWEFMYSKIYRAERWEV